MRPQRTDLSYRRAAVENASSVGLVIILYDLLIEDLRQAISAIANRDTEARSNAIKHAFVVLQQLEGSLDHDNGAEAAKNLGRFYSVMRCRIFDAHFKVSAEILNDQVNLLLDVRKAWQQVDPAVTQASPSPAVENTERTTIQMDDDRPNASWTA
jgi:flagellar secretion chaperone FliS